MATWEISEDAALTILLHASKHPSATVDGALLAKPRPGGGWLICSAVALFHRSHVMAPCMEAALTQVRRVGSDAPRSGAARAVQPRRANTTRSLRPGLR